MDFGATIRRKAYWLNDFIQGSPVGNQLTDIKDIVNNRIVGYQRSTVKLDRLLAHAVESVPFYRNYKNLGLQDFPVVNKLIYRKNFKDFLSAEYSGKHVHVSSTSGSTGTPLKIIQNNEKRDRLIAELKLFGQFAGYESHEKMMLMRTITKRTRKKWFTEFKENIYRVDISNLDARNLNSIDGQLKKKNISALLGYGSSLNLFAKHLSCKDSVPNDYKVKTVIATGEAFPPDARIKLQKVFGESCKTISRYANLEMGILAQDHGLNTAYTLNYGSYFFEFLKLEEDTPAESGEICRMVVTDLHNYAFPFIRYDTGDTVIFDSQENKWPVLKAVYGRLRDVIYDTSGDPVSPTVITTNLWGIESVNQWQFIQETETGYILKIKGQTNPTVEKAAEDICNVLGRNAFIDIVEVDDIPALASNKRRVTVCLLNDKD